MKSVHKKTGNEFHKETVLGDTVTLKDVATGNIKRVSLSLYRKEYKEVKGTPKGNEKQEVEQRAQEVLKEAQKGAPKIPSKDRKKSNDSNTRGTSKEDKAETSEGTTLDDICSEIGMKPNRARQILRKNNIKKPGKSWTWKTKKDVDKIRKVLTE